jgi:hypothetical protein
MNATYLKEIKNTIDFDALYERARTWLSFYTKDDHYFLSLGDEYPRKISDEGGNLSLGDLSIHDEKIEFVFRKDRNEPYIICQLSLDNPKTLDTLFKYSVKLSITYKLLDEFWEIW